MSRSLAVRLRRRRGVLNLVALRCRSQAGAGNRIPLKPEMQALWGGDIRHFHPIAGKFHGVIGGPPCQAWSQLRFIVAANGFETAPDMIPEFERCVAEPNP